MLQLAICDDNIEELSNMIQLINEYRSSKHISLEYAVFSNGYELISVLEKGKRFDIYCLDIIMPTFTGIEVAKKIRSVDQSTQIIFFTSSSDYAFESYSVKALNYILKPISKEKLFITLDELLDRIKIDDAFDSIIVKNKNGIQRILLTDLVYAEIIGRNAFYHLISGKVIECMESFSSVCEKLLKHTCFMKTHRSYIVNLQYIDTIENNQITLQTLSTIPIAQGKSWEIKRRYLAFQMEVE